METIMKEIENIIANLQLSLEDGNITEENLEDDIKFLLENKIVDLIKNEIKNI